LAESDLLNAEFQCYLIPTQVDSALAQAGIQMRAQSAMPLPANLRNETIEQPFKTTITVSQSITKADVAALAGLHTKSEYGNKKLEIRYDMWAMFDPSTRNCHVCAETIICGEKEYVLRAKAAWDRDDKRGAAIAMGSVALGGAVAVGAALGIAASAGAMATAAAGFAATAATAAAASGTVFATSVATASATTAMTTMGTAAAASAAVPVVGWVVAAVIVVAIAITALVMWSKKVEIVEHFCDTRQKCVDKVM
jgi:hypothetical protein